MVISIARSSFTGYYIHDPFIVGQVNRPFLMGWFRFVHEAFGMLFIALFLLRIYLFFGGNRWVRWKQYVPLHARAIQRNVAGDEVLRLHPAQAQSRKSATTPWRRFPISGSMRWCWWRLRPGLVLFNWLRHSPILGPLVGWIPRVIALPNLRLIHFFLMFVFIAFGIFHVHLCMLISREEKRGLMDSIFIGYKVIPVKELDEEEAKAELSRS